MMVYNLVLLCVMWQIGVVGIVSKNDDFVYVGYVVMVVVCGVWYDSFCILEDMGFGFNECDVFEWLSV